MVLEERSEVTNVMLEIWSTVAEMFSSGWVLDKWTDNGMNLTKENIAHVWFGFPYFCKSASSDDSRRWKQITVFKFVVLVSVPVLSLIMVHLLALSGALRCISVFIIWWSFLSSSETKFGSSVGKDERLIFHTWTDSIPRWRPGNAVAGSKEKLVSESWVQMILSKWSRINFDTQVPSGLNMGLNSSMDSGWMWQVWRCCRWTGERVSAWVFP